MDNKLLMRKDKTGRILLLGCPAAGCKGRIALVKVPCVRWHIAIKTQDFQHPGCIDFRLVTRQYTNYPRTNTRKYSKCYIVSPGPSGKFYVDVRWTSGHSPYPEIIKMELWIFGIHFGPMDFPKAPDEYRRVAPVIVLNTGQVLVDGQNAGFWPELLE